MVTPAQQIANDIEAVEAYLLARLTTDFPMFDDVQLGKYDGDADSFQGIFRPLLIVRTAKRYDDGGAVTALTLESPEGFDAAPEGERRANRPAAKRSSAAAKTTPTASSGRSGLDGTAQPLATG